MSDAIETFCSHIDCNNKGIYSLSKTYGIIYNGPDSELLFCKKHFESVYPIYCEYKNMETSIILPLNRHCNVSYYLSGYTSKNIYYISYMLTHCINKREEMASCIKSNISSTGHKYFIETLEILNNNVLQYTK